MAIIQPTASKNIVLGAGYLYFDKLDDSDNPVGERYVAETPGFSLALNTERLEAWSSDGPIAEKLLDITTRVTRDFNLTVRDIAGENLALFLIADTGTESTAGGSVTDEDVNGGNGVKLGHWYQLGVSATHPAGVRNISALTVKDASGAPSYTEGTDYTEDLELGRIQIIDGGAISADDTLKVDYTEASGSWEQISSTDTGAKEGALRYIADNTAGTHRDLYVPKCRMNPQGDFSMKSRDTIQEMGFVVSVLKKSGYSQVYLNGRAV